MTDNQQIQWMEIQSNTQISDKIQIWDYYLDLNEIRYDFKSILSSSNPFELHNKIKVIKDKFSNFLNNIADEVVNIFSLDNNKYSISDLYYNSKYHFVIFRNIEEYILESKYFDLRFYFGAVVSLDKDKQYLAKILLKLYQKVKDEEINKFLVKFKVKKWCLDNAKRIYNNLQLWNYIIDQKYLNENDINLFIENIYLNSNDSQKQTILNNFSLLKFSWDFRDVNKLFSYIVSFYLRQDYEISWRTKIILDYINNEHNVEIKKIIDWYINNYEKDKSIFYSNIIEALNSFQVDKIYFWSYIKSSMIDKYFPNLKKMFYWNMVSWYISDRLMWNSLSWNLAFNKYTNTNLQDDNSQEQPKINKAMVYKIMRMLELKSMIIDMEKNMWWTFIKPLVYNQIIEHLKIDKKSFDKLQFILCFILAKDYYEYKMLYNFFYEIKVIYGMESFHFRNIKAIYDKVKISMSLIIVCVLIIVWLFYLAPVAFTISIFSLMILYLFDYFRDNFYFWIKWNAWLKAFAYIACILTWFSWIINLWKSLESSQTLIQNFNSLNQVTASQAIENIETNWIKFYVDILIKSNK